MHKLNKTSINSGHFPAYSKRLVKNHLLKLASASNAYTKIYGTFSTSVSQHVNGIRQADKFGGSLRSVRVFYEAIFESRISEPFIASASTETNYLRDFMCRNMWDTCTIITRDVEDFKVQMKGCLRTCGL